MSELLRRLKWFLHRATFERELEEEMRHHLALRGEAGMKQFGNIALLKEDSRAMWTWTFWEQFAQDLRYGIRAMAGNRLFTAMAVLSLALGIGANTAIYSFMDAIMVRALPIPHPENLVVLNWRATKGWPAVARSQHGDSYKEPGGAAISGNFPYPAWQLLRERNTVFSTLFASAGAGRLNVVARNETFLVAGEYVSGNYFAGLQAPPAAGRLLGEEDDRPGAAAVAVITYGFWKRAFNAAADTVGKAVVVNGKTFTVAGVTAPEFYGIDPRTSPGVFLPLHTLGYLDPRAQRGDWFHEGNNYWVEMMGRLSPGFTLQKAQTPLAGVFHQFVAATAKNDKQRSNLPELWLQPGGSGIDSLRRQYSRPLYVLMAMVGLILAIACANIANLLLSRATARRREIAVRLSLGAGRWRVIRQLLTESLLLALLSGLAGLFVAALGVRFLTWLIANGRENFTLHAQIDLRILLFAMAVSLLTGIVFGLVPAIQATRVDVTPALKESRVGIPQGRSRHFGLPFGMSHLLVTAQIALALLLAIAAGLFVRTLSNLHSVSIGFNTENLLTFSLNSKQAGYDEPAAANFYEAMRHRFETIPGVRAATMTNTALVAGQSDATGISIPGIPADENSPLSSNAIVVGPSFFETLQIPILRGRAIGPQDSPGAPGSVVVNEVFARRFFPDRDPLGQHFELGTSEVQIVGVARDTRYSSVKREVPPVAYLSWQQPPRGWLNDGMVFEVRTVGDPLVLTNWIRGVVHQVNPRIPVADVSTQQERIEQTISQERTFADLCTCFGILALLISCVGLYGTMAYAVARRTSEIGIRVALGAQRRRVIWMVLREVLALSVAGLAMGLTVAWGTAHFVASFLFGVKPNDPVAFALSAAVLMVCALAAGYAPAWQASRIDPMVALRHE
jgi:macrolide transport system ATP-binding/permease protein